MPGLSYDLSGKFQNLVDNIAQGKDIRGDTGSFFDDLEGAIKGMIQEAISKAITEHKSNEHELVT